MFVFQPVCTFLYVDRSIDRSIDWLMRLVLFQIIYHRLQGNNKFMLLSSDGLFDFLNEDSASKLVIEHMGGRRALQPFVVAPNSGVTLGELNVRLKKRMIAQAKKPDDANVATHVIRHALGRTEIGLDMSKLSRALSASVEEARYQRDDMTVQVVFFDTDYLRMFSPMEPSVGSAKPQ